MWVLKLLLDPGKQLLGSFAIKHNVSMLGYPLSYYTDKDSLYLIVAGTIFGEKKNKRAFVNDGKRSSDIPHIEFSDDFGVAVLKQPLFSEAFYHPEIIYLKPVVIRGDGYHAWHLASFNRKVLENVLKFAEKHIGGKLLSFRKEKIANMSFTRVLPGLTGNQKRAMEIAINGGYYDYPKKVKMEKLAAKMGISYSTYQAHLKKAEGKILPEIYKEL
jgi:predicted DNA binding protein